MVGSKKNALHRVFISYHHDSDQSYKDSLVEFAERHGIFINESVDTGDISDELSDESIRKKIRDEHLRHSTVTIVLVGTQTKYRKHVDWEIHSSMYDGAVSRRSGILVIMLPHTNDNSIHAPHGQKEKNLYPDIELVPTGSRDEYGRHHPYMPERLLDNITKPDVKMSVIPWGRLNVGILSTLVDVAFRDREDCKYDLSRPMVRRDP